MKEVKKNIKKYDLTKDELEELRYAGRQISEHEFLGQIYNNRFNNVVSIVLKRLALTAEQLEKEHKMINPDLEHGTLEIFEVKEEVKNQTAEHSEGQLTPEEKI